MSETAAAQQMAIGLGSECRSFRNSVTDTTYRLRLDVAVWRITKSRSDRGVVILRHLRGEAGSEVVPQDSIARLVRGDQAIPMAHGDPAATFSAVVRWDLDRTYDVLVALASEARQRFERGAPGFRPRAPVLRAESITAMATAEAGCRSMTQAWLAAGLPGEPMEWMRAAAEDASAGPRER